MIASRQILNPERRFSLPLLIDNQRVLGVVGLPVGECLDVGPFFVVTYPQEGSVPPRTL